MKEKLYINDTLSVLEAAGSHPEGSSLLRQQLFISLGQDWAECLLPLFCQVFSAFLCPEPSAAHVHGLHQQGSSILGTLAGRGKP